MSDLFKLIIEKIFYYFWNKPGGRYLLAVSVIISGVLIYHNPDWVPDCCKPSHKCRYLKLMDFETDQINGDDIKYIGERECEDNKLIAIEWFGFNASKIGRQNPQPTNFVSAGLKFKRDVSESGAVKDEWKERTIFQRGNDFQWKRREERHNDRFKKNSCDLDTKPGAINNEIRDGFILQSLQPRSSHLLTRSVWSRCNYGSPDKVGKTEFLQFKDCKYEHIELFIPESSPKNLCDHRTNFDEWFNPRVKKTIFGNNYEILKDLSRKSVNPIVDNSISDAKVLELQDGLPKICMRFVDLDYKPFRNGNSQWSEFASIGAVWCDH